MDAAKSALHAAPRLHFLLRLQIAMSPGISGDI